MPEKQISNPGGAFAFGASWGNAPVDNAMTTETAGLINNTGLVLYTGDIVGIDATGTQAVLTATGNLTNVIGTVGSPREMSTVTGAPAQVADTNVGFTTLDGTFQPFVNVPWQTLTLGFTNGSGNITSAQVSTVNPLAVGDIIITPYNASTNATPQIFQVTSNGGSSGAWTAVGAVISGGGTTFSGTTGSFSSQVGTAPSAVGPGFLPSSINNWTSSSTFPPGTVVPIITRGFGRVNVNGVAAIAAGDGLGGTNASVVGTRFAYAGTGYASAAGLIIAVALEAYAARDVTLTGLGITGHDSIRAIIGKL